MKGTRILTELYYYRSLIFPYCLKVCLLTVYSMFNSVYSLKAVKGNTF